MVLGQFALMHMLMGVFGAPVGVTVLMLHVFVLVLAVHVAVGHFAVAVFMSMWLSVGVWFGHQHLPRSFLGLTCFRPAHRAIGERGQLCGDARELRDRRARR
jgi:hypothetical protein